MSFTLFLFFFSCNAAHTNPRTIYILISKKLATLIESDPKALFLIATTLGLLIFILDPYLIMLSVKQGGIKYHF